MYRLTWIFSIRDQGAIIKCFLFLNQDIGLYKTQNQILKCQIDWLINYCIFNHTV